VFVKGTCTVLTGRIPVGGQVGPISMVGDSLVLKNAQQNDTNNSTSETINRIIPHCKSFVNILYVILDMFLLESHIVIIEL
jgi:hypothetical protein